MRNTMGLMIGLALVALTGCAPTFSGEWLERGTPGNNDDALLGPSRAALQFDPISTVRFGRFDERGMVVDANSVQADQYFVFDGGHAAQFGSVIARLDGDTLVATVGAGRERFFTRVHGRSIFPPLVVLPQMYGAVPPKDRPVLLSIQE